MSIETEFESTITNVQNAYQGLDNLGATIPQNKTIENIKNCLDEIYNNLPKTAYAEGSNITLSNTLKGKLDFEDGIVGYGDTKQEGTPTPDNPQDIEVVRGKNRLKPITIDRTIKGVKITSSDNGKITIKGTATDSINEPIWGSWGGSNVLCELPQGSYVSSGLGTNSPRINIVANGTTTIFTGNSTRTLTSTAKITGIFLYINNGESVDMTFEPMIEKGSQATSYLPYNTIGVKVRGKNNLLCRTDIPIGYTRTDNGITWQRTGENTFKLNGTASGNFTLVVGNAAHLMENLKTGETYTLSGCPSGGSDGTYRLQIFNYNGTNTAYDTGSGATFVSNIVSTSNVAIRVFDGVTVNNLEFNMQIELGSTRTSFIPFEVTTHQLSLGEYEFAKIGNYVDTIEYDVENDKVYKNGAIRKRSITDIIGDRTITYGSTYSQFTIAQNPLPDLADNSNYANQNYTPTFLCNSYKASTFSNSLSSTGFLVSYLYVDAVSNRQLRFKNSNITDVNTFISSVANDYLVYPLAIPTKTEITGTLKDQIKALYYSQSFTGTTIIEIDGQLPLVLKVRALKGE